MKNVKIKSKDKLKFFIFNKKFKYNSLMSAFVVIFIAIVFILNVVVSNLVNKFDLKVDLTSYGLYRVSDETREFLKDYDKKARIIVLNNEDDFRKSEDIYTKHLYNMVKNIVACSENLSLEFVNLNEQPNFAAKYPNLKLQQNGILITDENNNARFLSVFNMFKNQYQGDPYNYSSEVISDVEKNIASALEFVAGRKRINTVLISGHDEINIKSLKGTVFDENGYNLIETNLSSEKISDDTDLVFIVAPIVDYSEEEIKKLQDYVNAGKKIVYFASASQKKLERLEKFLEKNFGVSFEEGVVIETDGNRVFTSANDIFTFAEKENKYVQDMLNRKLPINFNDCKPLSFEKREDVEGLNICGTGETATILTDPKKFDVKTAKKKSFPLVACLNKNLGENKKSSLVVFCSSSILGGLDIPHLGNFELMFSVLGEFANNKSKIKILPKTIGVPRLAINRTTAGFMGVLFILILPLLVIISGIVVYYKRRRK